MNMLIDLRIKELERAIKLEQTELDRMAQMLFEQGKKLYEDAELISRSKKLDAMVNDLHRLKKALPPE